MKIFRTNKLAAFLGMASLVSQQGEAQFVEILCQIETYGYYLGDTNSAANAETRVINVRCVTGEGIWRIENDSIRNSERVWAFDGTNVYQRLGFATPGSTANERIASTNETSRTSISEKAQSGRTIHVWKSGDGHPLGGVWENIPWLAFCSGDYLKRAGRIVPLSVDDLRHTRDRFGYQDVTTVYGDELGLPKTVDLFTSKALLEASENEFDREAGFGDRYVTSKKKRVAELQEGLLMFHYAVLESTNVLGRNFPTKFEYVQNGRPYEQNGNWFHRGIGRVISIRSAPRPEPVLTAGVLQNIVDWRFAGPTNEKDGRIYQTSDGFVTAPGDSELLRKPKLNQDRQ